MTLPYPYEELSIAFIFSCMDTARREGKIISIFLNRNTFLEFNIAVQTYVHKKEIEEVLFFCGIPLFVVSKIPEKILVFEIESRWK